SIILALAGHAHSEQVAVKLEAGVGVPHHDGRMIDAEEQFAVLPMPFFSALIRRELKNLNGMLVWIFEIEGGDAGCVFVPVRESLRSCRRMLHLRLAELTVGLLQVAA